MIRALCKFLFLATLSGLAAAARAEDPAIADLRTALDPLRGRLIGAADTDDAIQALTPIKHLLRDWVEHRLDRVKAEDDEARLVLQLNDLLRHAGLDCGASDDRCKGSNGHWNASGSLGELRLEWQPPDNRLVLRTRVGIDCGYDESVYVYARGDGDQWHRLFESEAGGRPYEPQIIAAVHVVTAVPTSDQLILTLGSLPRCSSIWQPARYRLWRVTRAGAPKLLLDGSEIAYLGHLGSAILGSVGPHDMLIEFRTASLDDDTVHNRAAVRHFAIDGDTLSRIDPIALGPRDFVEEWVAASRDDAESWTERPERAAASRRHDELHGAAAHGTFIGTTHCSRTGDVWQVGVRFAGDSQPTYFLVRWEPPYRFRLVGLVKRPRSDCPTPDPEADAPRTLFPVQEWR